MFVYYSALYVFNLNSFFLRAVVLLQSMSSTEELAFALGSYGRALW